MTGMNVQAIVTRVQRQFGDESGVQLTEADIIRWINDATREAVMQHENLSQQSDSLDTTAGLDTYTLPATSFTLQSVSYKAPGTNSFYPLNFMAPKAFDEYFAGWDGTDMLSDVPSVYTRGPTSNTLRVFPAPSESGTDNLKVIFSAYGVDVDDLSDALALPEYYHQYVLEYCLMKAYEMDEDWEAADRKAQYVQSTLDFNNNRESWFGRDTYPTIVATSEDYL